MLVGSHARVGKLLCYSAETKSTHDDSTHRPEVVAIGLCAITRPSAETDVRQTQTHRGPERRTRRPNTQGRALLLGCAEQETMVSVRACGSRRLCRWEGGTPSRARRGVGSQTRGCHSVRARRDTGSRACDPDHTDRVHRIALASGARLDRFLCATGANVTGLTVYTGIEVGNKRVQFLREIVPPPSGCHGYGA